MSELQVVCHLLEQAGGKNTARFLDLGAFTAGESYEFAKYAEGWAIEADPYNFATLNQHPPCAVEWGAIASYSGTCDFWACEAPADGRGSGSIREPTGHLIRNGQPYIFKKIQIPCTTLDDFFARTSFGHLDLIWADLQGGEKDMILGGQKTLARTRYMLIESEYDHELYKDQAMRPELLSLLPGWVIQETFDFNLLMRNDRYLK